MLGMLASGLGSGLQAGISGLQTVFGWFTGALRFVGGHLMGFAGILARMVVMLAGFAVGGLVAFMGAIVASTKAASDHARAIINLRNSTGMSTGQAQGIAGRFGAFGIGPDALGNGGQYHGITQMTGRAFGVDPFDPTSINSRAQSFGGGMMGFQMKQAMLSSIGQNNSQGQFLANLPSNKVASQVAFQQNASASMGITPDVTRRLAEDLPLVIQRFSVLKDLLVSKIAAAALPYLENALTRTADFLAKNGEAIANGIGKAIEWMANAFTWLGNFLIANGSVIVQSIFSVVEWLYAKAPILIIGGLQTLIKAGMGFIEFFAGLAHSLADQLRAFDQSKGALYAIVAGIAGIFDSLINTFRFFGGMMATTAALMQNIAALSPLAQALSVATGNGVIGFVNPVAAAANYFNANPESNIAGMIPQLQNGTATKWADSLDAGADKMTGASDRYGGAALQYLQGVLDKMGPEDQRRAEYKAMIGELQQVNQNTKSTARNTEKTADRIGGFASQTINRTLSYIAEDAFLGVVGS